MADLTQKNISISYFLHEATKNYIPCYNMDNFLLLLFDNLRFFCS